MAHPHVERAAETKREAALGLVELHRGHPDIHHDAIDRIEALRGANFGKMGKPVLDQGQPAARLVDEIEATLKANGKVYEIHRYDGAGHAFFCTVRPSYRVEAALDGWERIFTFLGHHLAA